MPPERCRAIWLRRSQSPTCCSRCSIRSRRVRPQRPYILPWTERFSRTVRFSSVVWACETVPIARRTAGLPADDVVPLDPRRARGGRQERRQHPDQGRLPGPVGPEEAVDLARFDRRRKPRRRRRSRRTAWSVARPRWAGASSRPGRSAAGLDDEGLARDDRPALRGWRRTEKVCRSRLWRPQFLRVANSERGLIDTIFAWNRASGRACGQTVTWLADGEGGEPLLGNLDAQVGRLDLERHDRLARLDPLALAVVAREHGAARGRVEDALLLEPAGSSPGAR